MKANLGDKKRTVVLWYISKLLFQVLQFCYSTGCFLIPFLLFKTRDEEIPLPRHDQYNIWGVRRNFFGGWG